MTPPHDRPHVVDHVQCLILAEPLSCAYPSHQPRRISSLQYLADPPFCRSQKNERCMFSSRANAMRRKQTISGFVSKRAGKEAPGSPSHRRGLRFQNPFRSIHFDQFQERQPRHARDQIAQFIWSLFRPNVGRFHQNL